MKTRSRVFPDILHFLNCLSDEKTFPECLFGNDFSKMNNHSLFCLHTRRLHTLEEESTAGIEAAKCTVQTGFKQRNKPKKTTVYFLSISFFIFSINQPTQNTSKLLKQLAKWKTPRRLPPADFPYCSMLCTPDPCFKSTEHICYDGGC